MNTHLVANLPQVDTYHTGNRAEILSPVHDRQQVFIALHAFKEFHRFRFKFDRIEFLRFSPAVFYAAVNDFRIEQEVNRIDADKEEHQLENIPYVGKASGKREVKQNPQILNRQRTFPCRFIFQLEFSERVALCQFIINSRVEDSLDTFEYHITCVSGRSTFLHKLVKFC